MEDQEGAVNRFGERACKKEFASVTGFAREAEVLFAKGSTFRDHVVDKFIE
jgi:hypothetical protein